MAESNKDCLGNAIVDRDATHPDNRALRLQQAWKKLHMLQDMVAEQQHVIERLEQRL